MPTHDTVLQPFKEHDHFSSIDIQYHQSIIPAMRLRLVLDAWSIMDASSTFQLPSSDPQSAKDYMEWELCPVAKLNKGTNLGAITVTLPKYCRGRSISQSFWLGNRALKLLYFRLLQLSKGRIRLLRCSFEAEWRMCSEISDSSTR
jgi:hypothetical protein